MADTATLEHEPADPEVEPLAAGADRPAHRSPEEAGRRRFTIAVVVGTAVVALPMLWLLWDMWNGTVNPLRGVPYDNFYDLQARAMFHGRLNLPAGNMGIEAFVHDGRQYTYFGIFPSILRMPFLLVTHSLDGKMTGPSILLAWLCTSLFSSLMIWRLRILLRGEAPLGRAEAASYGGLMALILGGSVVLYLAATPFIYNEDFAWSVPLTVGSLFALLGVLERPSWGRVAASGVLVLCAALNRTPTGYACIIAAGLVAVWFALGRGGTEQRRWTVPLLGVAGVPFLASCAVTYAKFGIPIGLPMADQVWASVNAHRRHFLAANGGKAFSFAFLPSTLWAYLQPFGLRLTSLFPFITPPTAPAAALSGAVLDQTYPTASIPATMPLLFLLTCWGMVTAFRRKAIGQVRLTRIVVLAAAAGTAGVLLWGYISERYMADFMPLLIIGGAIGLIDVWRRLDGRQPQCPRPGARDPGALRGLRHRGQSGHRRLAAAAVVHHPERPVRLGPAGAVLRLPALHRPHRTGPPVLGTDRHPFRCQPLLRPVPVDRQQHEGRTRPADPALHVDARGAEPVVHPHHRVHLQQDLEPLHPAPHPHDLRAGQSGAQARRDPPRPHRGRAFGDLDQLAAGPELALP